MQQWAMGGNIGNPITQPQAPFDLGPMNPNPPRDGSVTMNGRPFSQGSFYTPRPKSPLQPIQATNPTNQDMTVGTGVRETAMESFLRNNPTYQGRSVGASTGSLINQAQGFKY